MIYCVIPPALAGDLYDKLTEYYKDDPGVEVIIDRRKPSGATRQQRRRQARDPGPPPPAPGHVPPPRARLTERVVVHVDGGARGNPGPAGVGVVLTDEDGTVLARANDYIGEATNNTAEYRALLLGLERARELGAREVEVVNDSQLVARQVTGEYRVKKADLRPLHAAGTGGTTGLRPLVDPLRAARAERACRRARERGDRRSGGNCVGSAVALA